MNVNFSAINQWEKPMLILERADDTPIGILGYAKNVEFYPKYNEVSTLSFELPAHVDGKDVPYYGDVVGNRIVELHGIGRFIISEPEESGDLQTLCKRITASSLEYEFSRKKLSLPESTYKFFDSTKPGETVLGMIMEQMPTWEVGSVAESIRNKYRTFEISGENLYNFIKGTLQEAYNCIVDFDTMTRMVNVRDADAEPNQKAVYISRDNLAKDIKVTEHPEDMVTRLELYGADGVDIRDVNPTGDNRIVNLDYFMNTGNFEQALITKYNAWKALIAQNRLPFYNYMIQYTMLISEELAERAKLADLQGEYTGLDNQRAVTIQAIASGLETQSALDTINAQMTAKQTEINNKQADVDRAVADRDDLMDDIVAIRNACAFDRYFTAAERKTLDPYLIDNSVSESSFVASDLQSYEDAPGVSLTNKTVAVTGSTVTNTTSASGSTLYSIKGGSVNIASGIITADVISAVYERRTNGKLIISMRLGSGSYSGSTFPGGCISITGSGSVSSSASTATATISGGFLYFSLNASDYEKKSVAWDLYEYGESLLAKMSVPSYSFSVDSANFIALEDFEYFKSELELGQRVYIEIRDGYILKPICTGARIIYNDRPTLELDFSDTFTASDGSSKLIDLLDQSVSMGKTLSAGKFTYEAWTGSGADSTLHTFITSALDTAKNAILSSTEQAVFWDGAGLKLRKYANQAHTAYEPEQIWMSNNSIMMTDDNWATAKMAIGKFHDANLGDQWGVIAPMVVGTLLAGEELMIESQKQSGGTAVFKVDANGCKLYNSEFEIRKTTGSTTTQILLDPTVGMVMGTYPVLNQNGTINTTNAKFYVDATGNLHVAGVIDAASGTIGGWTIGSDYIGNASTKAGSTVGLASGTGNNVCFWAGNSNNISGAKFRVEADGDVYANSLTLAGGAIGSGGTSNLFSVWTDGTNSALYCGKTSLTDTNPGIWLGTNGISVGIGNNIFRVAMNGTSATITASASNISIGNTSIQTYIDNADTAVQAIANSAQTTADAKPSVFYCPSSGTGNILTKSYKKNDVWVCSASATGYPAGCEYICTAVSNPKALSDWTLTGTRIKGAKLEIDTEAGTINMLAANEITMASGSKISIAATREITISTLGTIKLGYTGHLFTVGGDSNRSYIYSGKTSLTDTTSGIYLGTDGISVGNGSNVFKVAMNGTSATITASASNISIGNTSLQTYIDNADAAVETIANSAATAADAKPSVFYCPSSGTSGILTKSYKKNDVWICSVSATGYPAGCEYICTAVSSPKALSDWTLTGTRIKGAKLEIDTEAGTINMLAANTITMASGSAINIAASREVTISTLGTVKLGYTDHLFTVGGDSNRSYIYSGKTSLTDTTSGIYLGTDGISVGNGSNVFKVAMNGTSATITASADHITIGNTSVKGYIDGGDATVTGLANAAQETANGRAMVFRCPASGDSGILKQNYKVNDIWICSSTATISNVKYPAGCEYVCTAVTSTKALSNWTLTGTFIKGAKLEIDTEAGTIDMLAANTITMASGSAINIAASREVTISTLGTVKIGYTGNLFTIGGTSTKSYIYSGSKNSYDNTAGVDGVYIGTDGIGLGKGVFYVTKAGAVTASNMTITGGSITIKDSNNTEKFKVTTTGAVTAGNLTITGGSITLGTTFSVTSAGALTATSGTIGGWTIGANTLSNGSSTSYTAMSTSGDYRFWAGNATASSAPFYVKKDGTLYASSATITGKITTSDISATGGTIGGWTLTGSLLYGGSSGNYVALRAHQSTDGNNGSYVPAASRTTTNTVMWIGASNPSSAIFYIGQDGSIKATVAEIPRGKIGGFNVVYNSTYGYAIGVVTGSTVPADESQWSYRYMKWGIRPAITTSDNNPATVLFAGHAAGDTGLNNTNTRCRLTSDGTLYIRKIVFVQDTTGSSPATVDVTYYNF